MFLDTQNNIDIIVPIYKNEKLTERCIDSILANIAELAALTPRLILINDSPGHIPTSELLKKYAVNHQVLILHNEANLGFVKSVNRCLLHSLKDRRDVVLVNSDTETFPRTLLELVQVAYCAPQIGFVSPRSNNASICSLPHFIGGEVPSPAEAYDNWADISGLLPRFHFTPTAIGFYLFINNTILANFGLLREDFGLGYEEENELILRANKAGYRAALANHSFAFHAGSASFGLLDFDLHGHQTANLTKIKDIHPEFLPLVQRYETSAHFRAERLLSELVGLKDRLPEVVFELTGLGPNHNGTNEFSLAVLRSFQKRHSTTFGITVICSEESFRFHELNKFLDIRRENENYAGRYAIAIKLAQPFDLHHLNLMEDLAPINIYAMLDTIADDCGYLSITHSLDMLWGHIARHASGIIYISEFSERMFLSRFPDAANVPRYTRLLPTKLASYPSVETNQSGRYLLVLGNHFSHKGSDTTAAALKKRFPRLQIVVVGSSSQELNNLRGYRSGTLSAEKIDSLFAGATAVVLPSHVEGFGFGLMHALSRRKVVFARDIAATNEILATFDHTKEVHLYRDDEELFGLVSGLSKGQQSQVKDDRALGWDDWVDGLARFCRDSLSNKTVFSGTQNRIRQSNILRKAAAWDGVGSRSAPSAADIGVVDRLDHSAKATSEGLAPARPIQSILSADGADFIDQVYEALLNRKPDLEGGRYYLDRLQSGVEKMQVIDEISRSKEAMTIAANIPGLTTALEKFHGSGIARLKKLARRLIRH